MNVHHVVRVPVALVDVKMGARTGVLVYALVDVQDHVLLDVLLDVLDVLLHVMVVLHSVLDALKPVMVVLVALMDVIQHAKADAVTIHVQLNVEMDANMVVILVAPVVVKFNVQ